MSKKIITLSLLLIISTMLVACVNQQQNILMQKPTAHRSHIALDTQTTWQKSQHYSNKQLEELSKDNENTEAQGWAELALYNQQSHDSQSLAKRLLNWQQSYPTHPGNQLLGSNQDLLLQSQYKGPKQIAIILPLSGEYAELGSTIRKGFLDAYFKHLNPEAQQQVKFYDSHNKNIQTIYKTAIEQGSDFIIGPLEKQQVSQLSNHVKNIPILALNYTPHGHASDQQFYEFGLLPEDEIKQMSLDAKKRGASKALILAEDSEWGKRLTHAFEDAWQAQNGKVIEVWHFKSKQNFPKDIASLLQSNPDAANKKQQNNAKNTTSNAPLRRNDIDMIVLFASQKDAQSILPLLRFNFVTDIPVYANATAFNDSMSTKHIDMEGVTICDLPSINKKTTQGHNKRFYNLGQDAYQISQSIYQLHNLPYFPIHGKTGLLTLSDNLQIHRKLSCQTIHQ